MKFGWLFAAGLLGGVAAVASAEVTAVAGNGFQIRNVVTIEASPERTYATLVRPERWWSSRHTWSGDAHNLSLELRPGGCWCERWRGGFAQHLQLVYAEPNRELGMWGALGPLRRDGFAGGLVITLAAEGGHTILTQIYTVGGYSRQDLPAYAAGVDQVWSIQLRRLKAVVEGRPPGEE